MVCSEQERNEALEARVKGLADKHGIRVEDIPPALHQAVFGDFITNELKKPRQGVRKVVATVKLFKEKVQPLLYVPVPPAAVAAAASSTPASTSASAASASSPGGQQYGAAGGVSASALPQAHLLLRQVQQLQQQQPDLQPDQLKRRLEEHVQQLVVQPGGGVGPQEDAEGQQQKAQEEPQEGGDEEERPSKKARAVPPPQAVEPFSFLPAFLSEVRAVGPLFEDGRRAGRGQDRLMKQLFHYFASEEEELRDRHKRRSEWRLRQKGGAANSSSALAADGDEGMQQEEEKMKQKKISPPCPRRSASSFLSLLQLQRELLSKEWICVAILEYLPESGSATKGLVQLRKGVKLQKDLMLNSRKVGQPRETRLMLVAERLVTAGKAQDSTEALNILKRRAFSTRITRYLDYPVHRHHDPKVVADKIVDFLDTKDDRAVRKAKILATLSEFGTTYRSDSSFIRAFETAEEDVDAEEVAAIMRLTSEMFGRGHIFWSHNHSSIEARCRDNYLKQGKTWQQARASASHVASFLPDVRPAPKRRSRHRWYEDWGDDYDRWDGYDEREY